MVLDWPRSINVVSLGTCVWLMIFSTAEVTLPRSRRSTVAYTSNTGCTLLLLRFRRGPHTLTLFADGRAIVHGTTDITVARSLYARFIGACAGAFGRNRLSLSTASLSPE